MSLDFQRARPLLQACDLTKLFVEELGWEPCHKRLALRADETDCNFTAIAEKRNFTVWLCESTMGNIPDHITRLKLDRKLSETSFEHLIVFVLGDRSSQLWMWVRREQGKPLAARTHEYHRGQPGDSLLQKLQSLYISLEEEEAGLSTLTVAGRARAAFDIERVTKAFYRDFDIHRKAFLKFIVGIGEVADREWYASVMLNRLMFVYFIQRKGFLDGNLDYLRNRLQRCKTEKGKDKFYSFYRYFLLKLFHEGFGKHRKDRAPNLEQLLGNIPYLNGGLFDVHELEKPSRYGKEIQIADAAFERIFDYFDQYQWHLDERPLHADNEINPDVLGYIFEKYINQKQMGAYYTKEDITEYIGKNTVLPFLFEAARKKCSVAFENPNGPTLWDLVRESPDRYIFPIVRHGVTWNYIPDHPAKGTPLSKTIELPPEIADGIDPTQPNLIKRRSLWNKPASDNIGLPTETWREAIARRQHYFEIKAKLEAGDIHEINDFVTLNLDIRQLAQDVITNCEGPELLRAVWHAVEKVTVIDPTCGSGAFLFAALNILEPLYEGCLDRMESFVADEERIRPKAPEDSIRDLIVNGESFNLEFKQTARWNVRESKPDKTMEQVIIKTVAALLNSKGGDLLIGVKDDGSIFGIEADYQLVSPEKRNRDAYENWMMTHLLGTFGKQHAANLRVTFAKFNEGDICRITVLPTATAVYVKENNQEALYVRAGNSTRCLTTPEAVAYHQQRFSQYNLQTTTVPESLKDRSAKKYGDFRKVLEMVGAHPNRRYFVLKSIILNNLFGVDIMEEAVEICKLRLFLKLASQVEPNTARDNLGIEPLPDIDFNIRAGNTLVGFATFDEVKEAVTSKMDFDNAMEKISMKAADLQQTFDKFRQLQTEGDGTVPPTDKQELQKRLRALEDELNGHLAGDYGVKKNDKVAYGKWLKSHLPFHWFIQFYGILNRGGFDVIIGNPPYVNFREVGYAIPSTYSCYDCGDLFAVCTERSYAIAKKQARIGLIIPLSATSTNAMTELKRCINKSSSEIWTSYFSASDQPASLFSGVRHRLMVLLSEKGSHLELNLHTTRFLKWFNPERGALFSSIIKYANTNGNNFDPFCKVSSEIEISILSKMFRKKELAHEVSKSGYPIYYHNAPVHWGKVFDFIPHFKVGSAKPQQSSHLKTLNLQDKNSARIALCFLNSSIFYWFNWHYSNCRDLSSKDILRAPLDMKSINQDNSKELLRLATKLIVDLKKNKSLYSRVVQGVTTEFDSFYPAKSKSILDEIDTVLANHYGFTPSELDFITNYDFKYRMGRDSEIEED